MRSFAHIVNPVTVDERSDLWLAQPVTFETMRRAKRWAEASGSLRVELYTAQLPEDRRALEGFTAAPDLARTVMECGRFARTRRLPLLGDILQRLYSESRADFFVYTNVDIGLRPEFYLAIDALVQDGRDAFSINRRTVRATPAQARELEWLCRQPGEPHPGHDCFVFRRELLEGVDLHDLCIGFPPVGTVLVALLSTLANSFSVLADLHLTFHINDDRSWIDPSFDDFLTHNRRMAMRILDDLARGRALAPNARAFHESLRAKLRRA